MALFKNNKKDVQVKTVDSGLNRQAERTVLSEDLLKDRLSPDGINPNALDYLCIVDGGKNIYIRSFYIEEVPKTVTFATTFAPLFNTPHVTSSVFINPMAEGEASKLLDKKIIGDETEILDAQKSGDRNKLRKLEQVLARDEQWAMQIETGNNKLYQVGFLFTLKAESLEMLNKKGDKFVNTAKEKGITLVSCYGLQAEAFLSSGPYNKIYAGGKRIPLLPIKIHPFDKYALASIFNHTNTFFSHPSGIVAGHILDTNEPVLWDPYAESHNGYNCVFCGITGTGKSATIKMYASRLAPFGYRFACIDSDKARGRGEYSNLCEAIGGINFVLKTNSPNKLNIFEIDEQQEYDTSLGMYVRTLKLADKSADVCNILMSAIIGTKAQPSFDTKTYMENIIKKCVVQLYRDKGIEEGEPDSLYESASTEVNGRIGAGFRKKMLPVMSEAYLMIAKERANNTNELHRVAYQLLVDSLSDFVDDLYYDADTFVRVSQAEASIADRTGRHIVHVHGTKGYFDGQSSEILTRNTPFINIDISDLPAPDLLLGQQVAMNFLMENFIKKNAENPEQSKHIVMIVDEAHRMFPFEESRRFLADQVRTARKKNASMWICTQNLTDFDGSDETRTIFKQAASKFILKQPAMDRNFIKSCTVMTDSAVNKLLSLGGDPNDPDDKKHKGEICLIDVDKVVFLKVDYLEQTESVFVETNPKLAC